MAESPAAMGADDIARLCEARDIIDEALDDAKAASRPER
jgi:hypothetical protein